MIGADRFLWVSLQGRQPKLSASTVFEIRIVALRPD